MNTYLIGFKGTGKTTLGRALAKYLNRRFVDLDLQMEEHTGKGIPDLYTTLGEEKFRELEHQTLVEVSGYNDTVVSTGGGAPGHFNNMDIMLQTGKVVYLQLDNNELLERLMKMASKRPILKGKNREQMKDYIERQKAKYGPIYLRAHFIVDAGGLNANMLAKIISAEAPC